MTVADIAAASPNALATGPFGSAISSRFFQASGVPVIRGSNLSASIGERLVENDFVFVSPEKAAEFSRSFAHRGDLVFTCWGTIGQVGLIDKRARYEEYVISNKQMKLTPDATKADSLFLYYVFSSPAVCDEIKNQAIGSSVPGFNLGQLKSIRLRLPPIDEQRAISHILGSLDEKVELNRRLNETLEAMARALFKSWFVDAGAFREGWRQLALSEAAEINPPRTVAKGGMAPYVEMSSLPTAGYRPSEWPLREVGSGARFQNGDTLLARITPCLENGKTGYVDFLRDGEVGWGSTEYIVIRPRRPLPPEWGYLLARDPAFRDFAAQKMAGTTGRQRVPADAVGRYPVLVPSETDGHRFGEAVRPLFRKMSASDDEIRTLAAIRDTLLPRLLSGEVKMPPRTENGERGER